MKAKIFMRILQVVFLLIICSKTNKTFASDDPLSLYPSNYSTCNNFFFYRIVFDVTKVMCYYNNQNTTTESYNLNLSANLKIFKHNQQPNNFLINLVAGNSSSRNPNMKYCITKNELLNSNNSYTFRASDFDNVYLKSIATFGTKNGFLPSDLVFRLELGGKINIAGEPCTNLNGGQDIVFSDNKIYDNTQEDFNPAQTVDPNHPYNNTLQYLANCDAFQALNKFDQSINIPIYNNGIEVGYVKLYYNIFYECITTPIGVLQDFNSNVKLPFRLYSNPENTLPIFESSECSGTSDLYLSEKGLTKNLYDNYSWKHWYRNTDIIYDILPNTSNLLNSPMRYYGLNQENLNYNSSSNPIIKYLHDIYTEDIEEDHGQENRHFYNYFTRCVRRIKKKNVNGDFEYTNWELYASYPNISNPPNPMFNGWQNAFKINSPYDVNNIYDNQSGENYTLYEYKLINNVYYGSYNGMPSLENLNIAGSCAFWSLQTFPVKAYPSSLDISLDIRNPCVTNDVKTGSAKVTGISGNYSDYTYTLQGWDFSENNSAGITTLYIAYHFWIYFNYIRPNNLFSCTDYNTFISLMLSNLQYLQPNELSARRIQKTQTSNVFHNLPIGIYRIKVKRANSMCEDTECFFITPTNTKPQITTNLQNILCEQSSQNNNNIDIEIHATSDIPITNWLWTQNTIEYQNTNTDDPTSLSDDFSINSDVARNCDIKIIATDQNGCKGIAVVELPNFTPPLYTPIKSEDVLQTNATKLKSIWLDDFTHKSFVNANSYYAILNQNPYQNGQMGIYRTLSGYDYLDSRKQSLTNSVFNPKLYKDGVIDNYFEFDWSYPLFDKVQPKWVKNAEIKKYNSNNEEIENEDMLNNRSAALFGFKETLPIGIAANARNNEIAFESFEEYNVNQTVTEINNAPCNFDIVEKVDEITYKSYIPFNIIAGSGRYIISDIPSNAGITNEMLDNLIVIAQGAAYTDVQNNHHPQEETILYTKGTIINTLCTEDQDHIAIQLGGVGTPLEPGIPGFNEGDCNRFWTGELNIVQDKYIPSKPAFNVNITNEKSHTGKNSIKINSHNLPESTSMEQYALELTPGKEYVISAWLSTDIHNQSSPKLLNEYFDNYNIGFSVQFLDADKNIINSVNNLIKPIGNNINGWQKAEYTFIVPDGTKSIALLFNNSQPFYLDDIRLLPANGNMQTYVYDPSTYRQEAILDQNNFSTIYKYDEEGKLFTIQKETVEGMKTIQVTQSFIKPQ